MGIFRVIHRHPRLYSGRFTIKLRYIYPTLVRFSKKMLRLLPKKSTIYESGVDCPSLLVSLLAAHANALA